jgi:hypothetical protein
MERTSKKKNLNEKKTNDELIRVVRVSTLKHVRLGVQFLHHAHRENLGGRGKSIFMAPHKFSDRN